MASEPADYTEAKGYEVVSRLLREHEEINVLYCENDNEALGAIIAVEEQGRKAGTDIKNGEIMIISFDAARAGLRKVLEGKIALDVECNPLQGPEIERIINDYDAGKEIEKYTYVSEQIFSADNTVKEIKASLVPLEVVEKEECKNMQGLSLRNITIKIKDLEKNKNIYDF